MEEAKKIGETDGLNAPAQIDVQVIKEIPPAEKLAGVVVLKGPENFLRVEIKSLFGAWQGYWLMKLDDTKKPD